MRFLNVALLGLVLAAVAGCGTLFGKGVTPEDASANAEDLFFFTSVVPAENVERAKMARGRALKMAQTAEASFVTLGGIVTGVGDGVGETGTPWGAIIAGLLGSGGLLGTYLNRREMNDPVKGARRRARTKELLGAVDAVKVAPAPTPPTV